jgi:peptide chain release factor
LKHIPTGTIVRCQDSRSREQNRDRARRKLGQMLERIVFGERDSVLGREAIKSRNQKRAKERKKKRRIAQRKQVKIEKRAAIDGAESRRRK